MKNLLIALVMVCLFTTGFILAAEGQAGSQQATSNAVQVQDGVHINNEGEQMQIQVQENNRIRLEVNGVSANCENCEMTQEQVQNKTKLYVALSNGQNAEIKVMPDTASETALNQLRVKVCSEENGCQLQFKEVGSGEQTKLAYELQAQKQAKVLGLFQAQMRVKAQIDAENGEVLKVVKPWWAFLASEEDETETEE